MKKRKTFNLHMLTFLLCTVFLFSSVFMSYGNTLLVKATDQSDLLLDAAYIGLASLGIILSGPTAAAVVSILGPLMLNEGKDVYDYVTDNGDGTTTISQDFIQLTLQAYQDYVKENFDGTLSYNPEGGYYEYGPTVYELWDYGYEGKEVVPNYSKTEITGFSYYYPVALLYLDGTPDPVYSYYKNYNVVPYFFNGNPDSDNGGIFKVNDYKNLYVKKPESFVLYSDRYNNTQNIHYDYFQVYGLSTDKKTVANGSLSCPTIPVYTSYELMKADLQSGKFTNAENFRPSGQSSMYTGTYSGGDITVQNEKLESIEDKLNEINETDKSIDDKLKDLLDWLGIGDGSGETGNGSLSGFFDSVLSYLQTIVLQLNEVLFGLDAIYDKMVDMTEVEVSEKTDSMLSSLFAAFSEIGDLLKGKFPFSIPWDFYSFLSLLAGDEVAVQSDQGVVMLSAYGSSSAGGYGVMPLTDDPEDLEQTGSGAPVFVIPFQISDEIGYPLIIDLEPFDPVSKISRTMLTVLYCIGLMHLTFKVISLGKELTDD